MTAFALLMVGPAFAQTERTMRVKDCGAFCKLWRNLSGNAQVSFADPIPNAALPDDGPAPAAEEGAGAPRVNTLVVRHGELLAISPAERKAMLRRRMAFEKRISDLKPGDGPK